MSPRRLKNVLNKGAFMTVVVRHRAYLGRITCLIVPATAKMTNIDAATTYAQPKNGFFPPIHDTVEMTTDFVPLYGFTG